MDTNFNRSTMANLRYVYDFVADSYQISYMWSVTDKIKSIGKRRLLISDKGMTFLFIYICRMATWATYRIESPLLVKYVNHLLTDARLCDFLGFWLWTRLLSGWLSQFANCPWSGCGWVTSLSHPVVLSPPKRPLILN